MFYIKTIKDLRERLFQAELDLLELKYDISKSREACDLLADEMGFEIDECECCGDLTLVE